MFSFLSQSRKVAMLCAVAATFSVGACAHQQASDRNTWQSYQMHQTQSEASEQVYRRYPNFSDRSEGLTPYGQAYTALPTGAAAGGTYGGRGSEGSSAFRSADTGSSSGFSAGHDSGAGVYATGHAGPDATSSFESFSHAHAQSSR